MSGTEFMKETSSAPRGPQNIRHSRKPCIRATEKLQMQVNHPGLCSFLSVSVQLYKYSSSHTICLLQLKEIRAAALRGPVKWVSTKRKPSIWSPSIRLSKIHQQGNMLHQVITLLTQTASTNPILLTMLWQINH